MNKIDWYYNYSDDQNAYRAGLAQVKQLLEELLEMPYTLACEKLELEGYPYNEPSVSWVFKRVQDNASIGEVMQEIVNCLELE